jgi:hypothetical protein
MKQLVLVLLLFNSFNVLSQGNELIDVKNTYIHEVLKQLNLSSIYRTNDIYSFQFDINKNGEAINIILPENLPDSLRLINQKLFSKIKFVPIDIPIKTVYFKAFVSIESPSINRDLNIGVAYENELKRFTNAHREEMDFLISNDKIEIRPHHYYTIGCGTPLLSYSPKPNPLEIKLPKKITFPRP